MRDRRRAPWHGSHGCPGRGPVPPTAGRIGQSPAARGLKQCRTAASILQIGPTLQHEASVGRDSTRSTPTSVARSSGTDRTATGTGVLTLGTGSCSVGTAPAQRTTVAQGRGPAADARLRSGWKGYTAAPAVRAERHLLGIVELLNLAAFEDGSLVRVARCSPSVCNRRVSLMLQGPARPPDTAFGTSRSVGCLIRGRGPSTARSMQARCRQTSPHQAAEPGPYRIPHERVIPLMGPWFRGRHGHSLRDLNRRLTRGALSGTLVARVQT